MDAAACSTGGERVPRTAPVGGAGGSKRVVIGKGRWTTQEHQDFLDGLERYGKDWQAISEVVKTRTHIQVRTHHQKYQQQQNKKGKRYPRQEYEVQEAWTDRAALVALFRSTCGARWKQNYNWETQAELSEWYGVEVNHESRVDNNSATIPSVSISWPNASVEIIHDDVLRWLYYLYLRAPESTVILVANKCDGSIDDFKETAERVEARVREQLSRWHEARGLRGQSKGRVTDVSLVPGVSRVSCRANCSPENSGLTALINLISGQVATSVLVPPVWDLALEVIGALRVGCDPIPAARKKLQLPCTTPAGDGSTQAFAFISKLELSRQWRSVVENVRGEAHAAAISNPEGALEGALWISDFAGYTLRIDGGDGIFLDVLWLSKCLKPILSHQLGQEKFEHGWLSMRDNLVRDGILRRPFAVHLWSDSIGHAVLQLEVARALFMVLVKLGVALPLGPSAKSSSIDPQDMLVIMRLPETCSSDQRRLLDNLAEEMPPGEQEVTLKWKFDRAGPPHGLVERLIASCHVLGKVQSGVCWKYGAVFKSHFFKRTARANDRLYTVALSMTGYNDPERELTARLLGPLEDERVWVAIRYLASAMVIFSKEWPGVLWEGWPECPNSHKEKVYLASTARVDDLLLPAAAPDAQRDDWCDCLLESSGVLGMVLEKLGVVVDTGKDPFEGLPEGEYDLPAEGTEDPVRCNRCVRETIIYWEPHAWRTAKWLSGLVAPLFMGAVVVGIVEDIGALWKSSLALVCFLVLLAVFASVFAFRFAIRRARDEQSHSGGGQHDTSADAVAELA